MAAALPPEAIILRDTVLPIVGLLNAGPVNNRQTTQFMNLHRLNSLEDFTRCEPHQAKELVKDYQSRYPNQGMGLLVRNNLTGLIWWAKDQKRRQLVLDAALINNDLLHEGLMSYETYVENKEKGDNIKSLPKFDEKLDFEEWDQKVQETLALIYGRNYCPLTYIVREDKPAGWNPAIHASTDHEALMYQLDLQGRAYESDNNTVFHLIQLAVLQTPAHTWIEDVIPTRDGRGAMIRLRNYYEGPANLHTRQQIAMQVIDNLTYTNERTMTFEAMITKLTKAYNTLSKQGQHYVDNVKVDALAKRIKMPGNHTVGYALENMRTAYRNDFPGACQFLKSRMAEINASQQNASAGHRRISNVVKNPANWNGVDISNPFRNFTAEEWDKLGPRGQKLTFDLRKQDGNRKRPAGRGSGRGFNPRGRGRGAGGRYNTNRSTNTNASDNTRQVNETNTNERSNSSNPPISEVSSGGSVAGVSQVSTTSSERGSQNGTRYGTR